MNTEKRWFNPTTLTDIEKALDGVNGLHLFVPAGGGRWWYARRNGQTKRWKTRPADFRIPIKYGFKNCAQIEHTTDMALLRIAGSRDDAEVL